MADGKTIKIDGGEVSSELQSFATDIQEFEQALLDLRTMMLHSADELKGETYNKLFQSIQELLEQQKQILFFEQIVHDEVQSFIEEIGSEEQSAVGNFNV